MKPRTAVIALTWIAFANVLFVVSGQADAASLRWHNFIAGSGISLSVVDNGTTGFQDVTISATGGGVSNVAGGTNITCSPSTGSVVCSFTGTQPVTSGGTGLSSLCANGDTIESNGSAYVCTPLSIFSAGGDLTGSSSSQTVSKIQGLTVPNPTFNTGFFVDPGGALQWDGCGGDLSCTFGTPNVNFTVTAPPKTGAQFAESTSAGSTSWTPGTAFTTLATLSITIASGQIIMSDAHIECFGNSSATDVTYGIGIDSTSPTSTTHRLDVPGPVSASFVGAGVSFMATGLSAGSHSVKLMAKEGSSGAGVGCGGSFLAWVVSS